MQELENNSQFDLGEYASQNFYREVFLSLVDYKSYGGEASDKSRLAPKTKRFRETIKKYIAAYKEYTSYIPIKLTNAQQIAIYETTKIDTAYKNAVMLQFGNRLRMFINKVVKIKERIASLKNELKENGCSEVEVKERIKTAIIDPVNQLKLAISTKEISKLPKDFLDEEAISKIEEFLSAYPKSYKFKKNLIYYDAKACPGKHLFAYYKLAKICENSGIKSFNCFPIRKTYVPCHMTIDT